MIMDPTAEKVFRNLVTERLGKAGIQIEHCRKCRKEIVWLRTKNNNWTPLTLALVSHFADCPNAKDFRKK